jgi:zona occludens toxin
MINWLIGSSGGGKSYEAVRYHILPALEKGRHVITNLPVNVDYFEKINPDYAKLLHIRKRAQPILGEFVILEDTPEFKLFEDGHTAEPVRYARPFAGVWDYYFTDAFRNDKKQGPLFVIDECHFALPRLRTDQMVEDWYSTHRHFNVDVLLLTQSYGKVSKPICDNTQLVYRVRKATAFGTNDRYIRKVQDGFRGDVVNTSIREYEPVYFPLYKSHTQGASVEEFAAEDVTPLWQRWPFIGAGLCFLTLILMFIFIDFKNPLDARQVVGKSTNKFDPTKQQIQQINEAKLFIQNQEQKASRDIVLKAPEPAGQSGQTAKPEKPKDPLSDKGIHIVGHLKGEKKEIWIFALSQNGQKLQNLYDRDLKEIGYQIEALDDCGAWLTYEKDRRFVTCDSPQISVHPAVNPA